MSCQILLPQILAELQVAQMPCVLQREARMKKKSTKELYKEAASGIKPDPMHKQRVIAA